MKLSMFASGMTDARGEDEERIIPNELSDLILQIPVVMVEDGNYW